MAKKLFSPIQRRNSVFTAEEIMQKSLFYEWIFFRREN